MLFDDDFQKSTAGKILALYGLAALAGSTSIGGPSKQKPRLSWELWVFIILGAAFVILAIVGGVQNVLEDQRKHQEYIQSLRNAAKQQGADERCLEVLAKEPTEEHLSAVVWYQKNVLAARWWHAEEVAYQTGLWNSYQAALKDQLGIALDDRMLPEIKERTAKRERDERHRIQNDLLSNALERSAEEHRNDLIQYAADTIKGRWPAAEPIIFESPLATWNYAKRVIKGRSPEAELVILRDPWIACEYASDVIGGRWTAAEDSIYRAGDWDWYKCRLEAKGIKVDNK